MGPLFSIHQFIARRELAANSAGHHARTGACQCAGREAARLRLLPGAVSVLPRNATAREIGKD